MTDHKVDDAIGEPRMSVKVFTGVGAFPILALLFNLPTLAARHIKNIEQINRTIQNRHYRDGLIYICRSSGGLMMSLTGTVNHN